MIKTVKRKEGINVVLSVPGDKSISHRSVMFASISQGITEIDGFLMGEDCLATIECFKAMGINITVDGSKVTVHGKGINGLCKPEGILDVGNSGTTIRLLTGLLAGQNFSCEITGDESIQKRPMKRVIEPLKLMGAEIESKDGLAPLKIKGTRLQGIDYTLPVASAQVKSAVLLAGLYADGETVIHEPAACRDHTEIMLRSLGADLVQNNNTITIKSGNELYAKKILIPGDISSAAYFIVAGLIVPNSEIVITNVGVNITRTGIICALKSMGGNIEVLNPRDMSGEPVADIRVRSSKLKGTEISGDVIPRMIDEIPVFAIAALFAQGKTVVRNAEELKVKESNRIRAMVNELKKLGADIEETDDGMVIHGGSGLVGGTVRSYNDHRVAMSLAVAGLTTEDVRIEGAEIVDVSFPNFFEMIEDM